MISPVERRNVLEVAGKRILFVMAAEQEYGPHLQERFVPLMTGVGPVESAIVVAAELMHLKITHALPDLVVSLGSAGSQSLEQTQVYQISSVSYRDMDATALGVAKGVTPFLGLPAVLEIKQLLDGIPAASLSTGGNIVSGQAYTVIESDMVDMETYAVLRACQHFDVPFIGFRGISDGAEELRHIQDWTQYLHIIDERLAVCVDALKKAIEAGFLSRD